MEAAENEWLEEDALEQLVEAAENEWLEEDAGFGGIG